MQRIVDKDKKAKKAAITASLEAKQLEDELTRLLEANGLSVRHLDGKPLTKSNVLERIYQRQAYLCGIDYLGRAHGDVSSVGHYRHYRLPCCDHEQDIQHKSVASGSFRCKYCKTRWINFTPKYSN